MIIGATFEAFAGLFEEELQGFDEGGVVGEYVLADGEDGDAAVGYAEVAEDGAGDEEGLFADFEGGFGCVEVVSAFLGVGGEFCGVVSWVRWEGVGGVGVR